MGEGAQRGLTSASVRAANLALVLGDVLGATEPPSRADLAASSGLTRGTVSRLVDELVGAGLVTELEPVVQGRGRPSIPLVPGTGWVALGLEVNVTHVSARVVDLRGQVVAEHLAEGDFAGADPEPVLAALAAEGRALVPDDARLVAVHLALPGLVDRDRATLVRAPNLGWQAVDLASLLPNWPQDAPLRVGNEADYAALGVAWRRPGLPSDWDSFLYVSGEVGIGSAIVRHHRVSAGNHGWAGELGHVTVEPEGRPCGCGARGCLEQYAGQRALLRDLGMTTLRQVVERLAAGDDEAHRVVEHAGQHLGRALASAINLVDVQRIVLGGHLAALAPWLVPVLSGQLSEHVMWAGQAELQVEVVDGDPAASALGAGLAGLGELVADPAAQLGDRR